MRSREKPDWVGAVIATDGKVKKRAAEVIIRGADVVVLQPRKGRVAKSTYHQSGEFHVKVDPKGRPLFSRWKLPPSQVEIEQHMFSKSLENFASLLPYKGQTYNETVVVDLRELPAGLPVVQVSVGFTFRRREDYRQEDYEEKVVLEQVLREDRPRVCVRLLVLSDPREANFSA